MCPDEIQDVSRWKGDNTDVICECGQKRKKEEGGIALLLFPRYPVLIYRYC